MRFGFIFDIFSMDDMRKAVAITQGIAKLETSGNMTETTLPLIAATGVNLSMRVN